MTKTEPVKIKPVEARAMVLDALRKHNYTGRTTEIAEWTELHASVVRRAGLTLANELKLEAALVPGRGKGEYRFTITQLDLFEDAKRPGSWMEVPLQKGSGIWNSFKKLFK
jgi:DNA-binding IclR family transcriptional regulator